MQQLHDRQSMKGLVAVNALAAEASAETQMTSQGVRSVHEQAGVGEMGYPPILSTDSPVQGLMRRSLMGRLPRVEETRSSGLA